MKPWHSGWRLLVACVVIAALPLFGGQLRAFLVGVLLGLLVLATLPVRRSRPEVDYSEWREGS